MKTSKLEQAFQLLWDDCLKKREDVNAADFALTREVQFARHLKRKYRFDFAHTKSHVAIEIMGGIYNRGAHVRPAGYTSDCEKSLLARELMWSVVSLTSDMIDDAHINRIIDLCASRNFISGPHCDYVVAHTCPNAFPSNYKMLWG